MTPQTPIEITPSLIDLARAFEPDRYLAATLARKNLRGALIALAAFAADLRRIPSAVTEPMMGEIRLQWWRDMLATIANGGIPEAPLARALGQVIATYELPVPLLVAMTEARAFDLYDDQMPNEAALEGYLTKTEAAAFELALRVLGVEAGQAGGIAQAAGSAYGQARLLFELPQHLSRHRVPLPQELLVVHKISLEHLLRGEAGVGGRAMLDGVCSEVEAQLVAIRPQIEGLSSVQRAAVTPLAMVPSYLAQVRSQARNPLRDVAELAPMSRVWRIAMAHVGGRI